MARRLPPKRVGAPMTPNATRIATSGPTRHRAIRRWGRRLIRLVIRRWGRRSLRPEIHPWVHRLRRLAIHRWGLQLLRLAIHRWDRLSHRPEIRPWVHRLRRRATESLWRGALALLVSAGLLSVPAGAQTGDAQALFAAGRASFEAQDFAGALARFEQALAAGLTGPAVHYNIGVAAYRLGRLDRAEQAFHEVARTPAMAPLANYNLGLVALRRADRSAARRWFTLAAGSGDERLATLAARQLENLPAPAPELAAARAWSAFARAGLGADDNVALRSDSIDAPASGTRDEFAELQLAASVPFASHWRADAAAALIDYFSLDDFDQAALSLGARRAIPLGAWQADAGLQAVHLTLDGEAFEQSVALVLQGTRAFGDNQWLNLRYRGASVDGRGAFEGITGDRHELTLRFDWHRAGWNVATRLQLEDSDCEDETFDSRWTELGVSVQRAFSRRWTFGADAALRRTHRADADSTERRSFVAVFAATPLGARAQLAARYEHQRNSAEDPLFDYDGNRLSVAVELWR